ncbi:response regulator [Mesorhizobium sp. B2-4-9]|uniref:response regulator n=1 Tax=Mesorhizobium sp. B2-4-9 TaxID=2589940 RepID=UPI0011260C05|nr:response regulator [Mesorhizobium sp. B2-4-9]TPL21162.1 response regulator [Mesorhizobium sp. B2-4-9]
MSLPIAVLLVEDEPLIRIDIADSLLSEGSLVFEASDADEAIAILEANATIDVMFTDIDMPGSMDGLKLSAAVRDRWPPIKIVAMSGHRVEAAADLLEGSVFFGKPYDHAAVATCLRGLLSLSRG